MLFHTGNFQNYCNAQMRVLHSCMPVCECMQLHSNEADGSVPVTHTSMYWSTLDIEGGVEKRYRVPEGVSWKVRRRG